LAALEGLISLRDRLARASGFATRRDMQELQYRATLDGLLHDYGARRGYCPLGWAANSSLLYLVARCINELKIGSVLELGVGQTTLLLDSLRSQRGFELVSVEHDPEWCAHVQSKCEHAITLTSLRQRTYKGISYRGYGLELPMRKFDLIIVDGPPGGAKWPRFDVVPLAATHLPEDFVIIMDDAERPGERRTGRKLLQQLDSCGIAYREARIRAAKTQLLVASGAMRLAASF
jgi:hypothetical protein